MKRTADVVIVGGGCMGCSVAWHLAQRGITKVVLLEREPLPVRPRVDVGEAGLESQR